MLTILLLSANHVGTGLACAMVAASTTMTVKAFSSKHRQLKEIGVVSLIAHLTLFFFVVGTISVRDHILQAPRHEAFAPHALPSRIVAEFTINETENATVFQMPISAGVQLMHTMNVLKMEYSSMQFVKGNELWVTVTVTSGFSRMSQLQAEVSKLRGERAEAWQIADQEKSLRIEAERRERAVGRQLVVLRESYEQAERDVKELRAEVERCLDSDATNEAEIYELYLRIEEGEREILKIQLEKEKLQGTMDTILQQRIDAEKKFQDFNRAMPIG